MCDCQARAIFKGLSEFEEKVIIGLFDSHRMILSVKEN